MKNLLHLYDDDRIAMLEGMIDSDHNRSLILNEASLLGPGVIYALANNGIRIAELPPGGNLADYAATAKKHGIVTPPGAQGVFLPQDRTLYLIMACQGVIVHEVGHALDFCLNGGVPDPHGNDLRSVTDREFARSMYGNGEAPTAYAMTNPAEFFAECVRSYCDADATGSLFDATSAEKLRCVNRAAYGFLTEIFVTLNGRRFEGYRRQAAA